MKPLFVQWGGGNIGRSFIAQIFSRLGYRILIIDINQSLVHALNDRGAYTVETVYDQESNHISIEDVTAVHAADQKAINKAVTEASLIGVSVGRGAWPHIAPSLAEAILCRHLAVPENSIDIILAENIHSCKDFVSRLLIPYLGDKVNLDSYVGLAQTSIGKMVPIQDPSDLLNVRSEPYNDLIVDGSAFHNPLPSHPDIHLVHPIEAYVDRKLFIHNMGHSATAYFGYGVHPERETIAEVLEDVEIKREVKTAMIQSRDILLSLHPQVFTKEELDIHIADLLKRFSNKALGDTVHRVGRDLKRKLRYDDRLLGIIIKAEQLGKPWDSIGRAYLKALTFSAPDYEGNTYQPDCTFLESITPLPWPEKLYTASSWKESSLEKELFLKLSFAMQNLR